MGREHLSNVSFAWVSFWTFKMESRSTFIVDFFFQVLSILLVIKTTANAFFIAHRYLNLPNQDQLSQGPNCGDVEMVSDIYLTNCRHLRIHMFQEQKKRIPLVHICEVLTTWFPPGLNDGYAKHAGNLAFLQKMTARQNSWASSK